MYGNYYNSYSDYSAGLAAMSVFSNLISIGVSVLLIVAMWKIFTKAGEPGWKCLIPFYGSWTEYRFAGCLNLFWWTIGAIAALMVGLVFMIVGMAQNYGEVSGAAVFGIILFVAATIALLVISVMFSIHLAHAFGMSTGFGWGLALLSTIFLCILAFGPAQYVGENGGENLVKSVRTETWRCPTCNSENSVSKGVCPICGTQRPF